MTTINIHKFETTNDAYDATQCRDDIVKGDILIIEDERVIGIADTWPVAVTKENGKLHKANSSNDLFEYAKDRGWPIGSIEMAQDECEARGYDHIVETA